MIIVYHCLRRASHGARHGEGHWQGLHIRTHSNDIYYNCVLLLNAGHCQWFMKGCERLVDQIYMQNISQNMMYISGSSASLARTGNLTLF